eukprot:2713322-Pyramimonas_sp.AAC.1
MCSFFKELVQRGLGKFPLSCIERVGLLLAKKKSGHIRVRLDARRTSARFRPPPNVSMLTAEGLGRIEVEDDSPDAASLAV